MPDIGDLLTSRPASWIQLFADTQLKEFFVKKHCSESYCNCIVI